MSEVEETIERIKVQGGVEGYVICNKQGQVLRRFPTMSLEDAEIYSKSMMTLTTQARGTIRDLNPKNELRYLRVRAKKHEIMVAFDLQFIVIVIQRWSPSGERAAP
jgi:dynein light chain roadblock-type